MEQFMTEKGKLITTEFGFFKWSKRRPGAARVLEAGMAHLPFAKPEYTQVPPPSSSKSRLCQ